MPTSLEEIPRDLEESVRGLPLIRTVLERVRSDQQEISMFRKEIAPALAQMPTFQREVGRPISVRRVGSRVD